LTARTGSTGTTRIALHVAGLIATAAAAAIGIRAARRALNAQLEANLR
jgi:hypothetical protein